MANIKPFHALAYNRQIIKDMHAVISPPYDVITESEPELMIQKSPYNAVCLDLTTPSQKPANQDTTKHRKAREQLEALRKQNILVTTKNPCLYVIKDTFLWEQKSHTRIGLLCTVELEKPGSNILAHEKVLSTPIEDRMNLLKATKAHLSPIFFVCRDEDKNIERCIENLCSRYPSEKFQGTNDTVSHELWKITDEEDIDALCRGLDSKPLLIADGHHRYQTAYLYSQSEEANSLPEAKWMLGYISLFPSKGLVLSAFHRLVSTDVPLENFLTMLQDSFEITNTALSWDAFETCAESLALLDPSRDTMHLLKPKASFSLLPPELVKIPSSLLNSLLLNYLSIDLTNPEQQPLVSYFPDAKKILDAQKSAAGLAFWVKPVFVPDIFEATQHGYILPPKSTYFYPKVPTGLAFHLIQS